MVFLPLLEKGTQPLSKSSPWSQPRGSFRTRLQTSGARQILALSLQHPSTSSHSSPSHPGHHLRSNLPHILKANQLIQRNGHLNIQSREICGAVVRSKHSSKIPHALTTPLISTNEGSARGAEHDNRTEHSSAYTCYGS
jgi:hypothetical protein